MSVHAPDRLLATQLLAVRRYIRLAQESSGAAGLEARWSWTQQEAKYHQGLEPTRTLYAEARRVQAKFAAAHPGYTLALSPVRSLERQVRLWGKNATVATAGR